MHTITPKALPEALDRAGPEVRVLSLDCFDTLLWRATHRPKDVFAELPGCTAHQRVLAESNARRRAELAGRQEVTIDEIYAELLLNATAPARAAAVAAELAAEARHCFAFAPTVELMRRAKARGLQVVIVSDTYLARDQLSALLEAAAGADVLAFIDRIFVSSEHGMPKAGGLFRHVLKALRVPPAAILHLGDNKAADYTAPLSLGVQAIHLEQFDPDTEQRLRLEAAAAVLLSGRATGGAPVLQPHRAQLRLGAHACEDAPAALGYGVLGPVLHAYADWLRAEVEALQATTSGRVHLLFLMRDGHLPRLCYGEEGTHAVEISRFTAIGASLTDDAAILRYLEPRLVDHDPEVLGRQLHLTPAEVNELAGVGSAARRRARFGAEARRGKVLRKIAARADAYADRLCAYLRRTVDPTPGDTLVLADLGYNGTVQNHVEPMLRARLGVEVAGRYLLLHADDVSGLDKRGLLDDRAFETGALASLTQYMSVMEQLCTAPTGSTIDYRDGAPVRTANDIKAAQSAVRTAVQQAALAYVRGHGAGLHTRPAAFDADAARSSVAAILARLLYFPLPAELDALRSFEHDVNLGTSYTLSLFDPAAAQDGLRQWGLLYANTAKRMFLSAELRDGGMPLSLALLTNSRFGLDLKQKDFSHGAVQLPIMVAGDGGIDEHWVEARPTHDGWFSAVVPIGACQFSIGLQFGRLWEWVQLDAVHFFSEADIPTESGAELPRTTPAQPLFDGARLQSGGMLHCESPAGFMLVPPPPRADDRRLVLGVVFRPLAARDAPGIATASAPLLAAE